MNHVTCKELIDFLGDYIAGDLPSARTGAFERHLGVCPSCRAYLSTYRETITLAHAATTHPPIEDIPPEILTAVLATIARNTKHP
jgi:anti-sigma factor RsiW